MQATKALGHDPKFGGHDAEFAGHDPETGGHDRPKYAGNRNQLSISRFLCTEERAISQRNRSTRSTDQEDTRPPPAPGEALSTPPQPGGSFSFFKAPAGGGRRACVFLRSDSEDEDAGDRRAAAARDQARAPETDRRASAIAAHAGSLRDGFERLHEALSADKYRITVRVHADPALGQAQDIGWVEPKRGVLLDAAGVLRLAVRCASLQLVRRATLFLTPLPGPERAFLLIDDLTRCAYERLHGAGYRPALVQRTSETLQAVLAVQVRGAGIKDSAARRALNVYFRELNKRYGDTSIAGAVHPMRWPGSFNTKPARRRPDGTSPHVRLLRHQHRECEKATMEVAAALASLDTSDVRRVRLPSARHGDNSEQVMNGGGAPPDINLRRAWRVHFEQALAISGIGAGQLDGSCLDFMTALRLRATGHTREQVEDIMIHEAPRWRAALGVSCERTGMPAWARYAATTATEIFGSRGDADLLRLNRWIAQWRQREANALLPLPSPST